MLLTPDEKTRPADMAGLFELAPAKINLALHVVGRRPDGYHLLESIVSFAEHGDRLRFAAAEQDAFTLSGRFAGSLQSDDASSNLVLRARDALRSALQQAGIVAPPVAIHLEKNLPVASGLGGGSADAAATLRGLLRLWQADIPPADLDRLALSLGADVPMCLRQEPLMVRGIGEDMTRISDFPALALVLGNPMVPVSTPEIFRRLKRRDNPPIGQRTETDWLGFLATLRNDLEPPARSLVARIGELSDLLSAEGALLTRMTGSGASCFGVFASMGDANRVADRLRHVRPDWYFQATRTAGSELK